jgi:hypothetical protein
MHGVDPVARQIGKSSEVLRPGQPLGLEAAHLAGRSCLTHWCPTTDHPTHCGIAAQPLGIVHVLVAHQPSKTLTAVVIRATDAGHSYRCSGGG